jgi:hypothetical protein
VWRAGAWPGSQPVSTMALVIPAARSDSSAWRVNAAPIPRR